MRVAILSTYPPRHCGLATFATDLRQALLDADSSVDIVVAAVLDDPAVEPAPPGAPEVLLSIRQQHRADYARAAEAINAAGVDVVLVQHEYGIFGGESGEYLLDLTRALSVPYVATLHTLLLAPDEHQRSVLREVVAGAAVVTVFTALARDQLVRSGIAPWSRVAVVNHGAPAELQPAGVASGGQGSEVDDGVHESDALPELADHLSRRVISTFGLLSPGKGVEVAVRAVARVVEKHPDALYVVAGRTHPEVIRRHGEGYRSELERLTSELGLDDHVLVVDRYLSDADIRALLRRTEVFLTPYRHQEQVVSGVLTFALVAGCPVVSTPYFYATELLGTGAGTLVGFDDHEAMAEAVVALLADDDLRAQAAETAYRVGSQYTWPEVGRETLKLLGAAAQERQATARGGVSEAAPARGPLPTLTHLHRLVDAGGIVQHATGLHPDPTTGTCVDDVARLVIVADGFLRRGAPDRERVTLELMRTRGLDLLEDAWDGPSAMMRNFRDLEGRWVDDPHPGDHVGRTLWALGQVGSGVGEVAGRCRGLLHDILASDPPLDAPRTAAFAVIGLARVPAHELGTTGRRSLGQLAQQLGALYTKNATPEWSWFEDELTYDNARLAQALISAGAAQRDATLLRLGLESLEWYGGQCDVDSGAVSLVGNSWRRRPQGSGGAQSGRDEGDEQPLDAAALAEACVEAYRTTGSPQFAERARAAFGWFHGRNRWGLTVHDPVSGGCHDGVGPRGLNANEGAESTLAYLQAWLALDSVDLLPPGGHR
ncbi:glycosyltransferase [Knoellia locipacati]|uniref:glycosyltransferase n=1 Tax=Knoellia locipacati TaxID=882824 RepID=UPI00384A6384